MRGEGEKGNCPEPENFRANSDTVRGGRQERVYEVGCRQPGEGRGGLRLRVWADVVHLAAGCGVSPGPYL